jgi:hypothetical protein
MIIFFSVILANIIAAAILNRIFPIEYESANEKPVFRGEMISDSVCAAGIGLFKICGMILLFQTFITVLNGCGLLSFISNANTRLLAASFLEISNLSALEGLPFRLLPMIAASGAFGGICVIMQIKTVVGNRFRTAPFVCARIFAAAIAACCCAVLDRLFGVRFVDAAAHTEFIVNFNNFIPSVCLIMMIFLTVFKKRLAFSSNV